MEMQLLRNQLLEGPFEGHSTQEEIKNVELGRGGGVGVACSPVELIVPDSIPGVDWKVFSLHAKFSLSALWHLPWTSGCSSLFLSYFLYLSFPVQFARDTLIFFLPYSSLSWTLVQAVQKTQTLSVLSLCTIAVSVGTQLSGRNWCCSSTVEAGKKKTWSSVSWQTHRK